MPQAWLKTGLQYSNPDLDASSDLSPFSWTGVALELKELQLGQASNGLEFRSLGIKSFYKSTSAYQQQPTD